MKRFMLFAHEYPDARGGFLDFVSDFDTLAQAKESIRRMIQPEGWWQIVDLEERKIHFSNGKADKFPNDQKWGKTRFKEYLD